MWHTSDGDRVLSGKERTLFVHGAARLLDQLLEEARDQERAADVAVETGVDQFDRLEVDARIVLLRDVVAALTDPDVHAPDLTAANEAAVYAVFRFLSTEVKSEIALEADHLSGDPELEAPFLSLGNNPFYWRKMILAAYLEEVGPDDAEEENLDPACGDADEWNIKLEALADGILWDRDWEIEQIMDAPPDAAGAIKERMGIAPDYFVDAPGEPDVARVREAADFVRGLARADLADEEHAKVTLRYGPEGLAGIEYADAELQARHGHAGDAEEGLVQEVDVVLPLLLAEDAAKMLARIDAASAQSGRYWEARRARERLCHELHGHLPEEWRGRFWKRFDIAPGISVERDYGGTSVEFDLEKFAGVKLEGDARDAAEAAAEGLKTFLANLVSDPDYDFADEAVRRALVQTAEEMIGEFAGVEEGPAAE